MIAAWHPTRQWDLRMSKDEENEIERIINDKNWYKISNIV